MDDRLLRRQLIGGLNGAEAHMSFEEAVAEFPAEAMNRRPPNVPYTPWHILEHLRITQWDILEYIRDSSHYKAPNWPEDYWPERFAETSVDGWQQTVDGFVADRKAIEAILLDGSTELSAPLPQTPGHTIVREVRLLINHNAYHIGEFAILRQVMDTWGPSHRG
jgi:hypothetical protein